MKPRKNTSIMYEGGQPGGAQFPTEAVFRGEADPGAEERIKKGLIEEQYFIPQASGFAPVSEGLQRVRHRFLGIRSTEARPTDPRTIKQAIEALERAREDMDRMNKDTGPKVKAWSRRP